jgi:hypothetical protein
LDKACRVDEAVEAAVAQDRLVDEILAIGSDSYVTAQARYP